MYILFGLTYGDIENSIDLKKIYFKLFYYY